MKTETVPYDASLVGRQMLSAIDKAKRGREPVDLDGQHCVHVWRWAGDMRVCLRCALGIMRKPSDRCR